jgi:hypothetical protein
VVEAKAGGANIVVCGFDLTGDLSGDPVGRQMRRSLLSYMRSGAFTPSTEIDLAQLRSLAAARAP